MPENFRESADLTKIIKSILDSYPLGNGILRELLQNSDDASATKQTFILDLRTHPTNTIVDEDLTGCQGPALLAVNDTLFSEADWKAISKLHSSSKTADETKIGKFGIGVRACYHITDNPHFLSGRKLVVFDPHERFSQGRVGGVRIDVVDEASSYKDQLVAFDRSLSPNVDGSFPGTVVRLPLRNTDQALKSTIKAVPVDAEFIRMLFHDFVQRELSVVMLFLKHIRYICLKIILPDGQEEFFGSADIPNLSIAEQRRFSRNTGARREDFQCTINTLDATGRATSQTWRVLHSVRSTEETSTFLTRQLGYNVGSKLTDDKLFSHVALAFPVHPQPSEFNGRLFTLLPLPIHTAFPVHLHAILALTQDRQSLRNIEETGTGAQSRERLLVTWNRAIFEEFLPQTWGALLQILLDNGEVNNIWSAWPSAVHANTHGSAYWSGILHNLFQRVAKDDLPVFPTFPNADQHVPLSSAFIASEHDDDEILKALKEVGLPIVKLPKHIRNLISGDQKALVLNPDRASKALLKRGSALKSASEKDKDLILRYLVTSPGTVQTALGLPLIPSVRGPRRSLSRTDMYCLVTKEEGNVFGDSDCNSTFILLSDMHPDVAEAFRSTSMPNVTCFGQTHVRDYLNNSVFGSFNPADDEITGGQASGRVDWLASFWKWLSQLTLRNWSGLLPLVERFHLLPTGQRTLRKLESRIISPIEGANGSRTMTAWQVLGVRFLHPSVVPYSSAIRTLRSNLVVSPDDVYFLIDSTLPQNIPSLSMDSALLIQAHLVQCLRGSGRSVRLDVPNVRKFQQLPIFPTRIAVRDWKEGQRQLSQRSVGAALGNIVYVRVDDACPVLAVTSAQTTFFDANQSSSVLGTLINAAEIKKALNECEILERAIDQLTAQPQPVQDAFLSRMIPRLPDLSSSATRKLQSIPFIPVEGTSERCSPTQVVDPRSELASIYSGESGKLPRGRWGKDPFLSTLTAHVPLQTHLNGDIIEERITYLSRNWSEHEFPKAFLKAQAFLRLLDRSFSSLHPTVKNRVACRLNDPWLPIRSDTRPAAPSVCRDRGDKLYTYLFDLVLCVVSENLSSAALRQSLGWDFIPIHHLQKQLTLALTHTKNRSLRLHALVTEFARRSLLDSDIEGLQRVVSARPWIPISETAVVETKLALLRPPARGLGGRFKTVPNSLLTAHNGQGRVFLQRMGCSESPCLETLLDELELLSHGAAQSRNLVSEALGMLEEIGLNLPSRSQEEYKRIFVPGNDGALHPIEQVYFKDSASNFIPETGIPAHPNTSESLARRLEIQFLSALELGDSEDDEDDLQMGEAFTTRVKNVLKEHHVENSLNEFLANAVDAKATEFSVLLDERVFESSKVLTPALGELQRRSSVFLYNNATFTETDFRGLRMVGQGGKRSNPDSIGRYGLGALSLFHFTDVVQLISGEYFLLLDPSGKHLPPYKGRPRTSLLRRISAMARQYPHQLAAFESVHGFSASSPYYCGTLFRLPLRVTGSDLVSTVQRVSDCLNLLNGRYFELAKDAMFFTCLEHISASQQPSTGPAVSLWSVEAQRASSEPLTGDQEIISLNGTRKGFTIPKQRWLTTNSAIPIARVPAEYTTVLAGMGMNESRVGLVVRMALRVDSAGAATTETDPQPYFLFSSLRLPVQTSLLAHISAQFSISSDRRHIRFDPSDQSGHRAFNEWILRFLVPPMYISSIHYAANARRGTRNPFQWWPVKHDDEISRVVVEGFYDLAVKSTEPICYTVNSELLAPVDSVIRADITPQGVHELLLQLQPRDYVRAPREIRKMIVKALANTSENSSPDDTRIRFVDPLFVQQVIQSSIPQLRSLFARELISVPTLDAALLFMLKGEIPASTLPLLVLADGQLASGNSLDPIYVCTGHIPAIFSRKHFLSGALGRETRDLLVAQPEMNVKTFDAQAVVALLRDRIPSQQRVVYPSEMKEWISAFWDVYYALPGPPTTQQLRPLPLIPTVHGEYISLEYCDRNDVFTEPAQHLDLGGVVSAVQKMNLVICQVPPPMSRSLQKPFTIQSFLKAIQLKSLPFSTLSQNEVRDVAQWLRSGVYACQDRDSESRNILRELKIWEARQNSSTVLLAAGELDMLPSGVRPDAFDEYTTFGCALARYSHALSTLLNWPPNRRQALTTEHLATKLTFPHSLNSSDIRNYTTMLAEFLKLPGSVGIPVPDGNLQLRPAEDVYDHSVELFATALQSVEESVFLHPDFRRFRPQLHGRGLQSEVNWEAFLLCARTVDADLMTRNLPKPEVEQRAAAVHGFYDSRLPRIVMSDANKWRQLDGLRFIRRGGRRSTSSSYATDPYCQPLLQIVAPSQVLLRQHEEIAWTQRALLENEPSVGLTSLHKSFGVPTAEEVVNHLAVLALQVAPEHPRNRTLIQQLRATYQWLNEHKDEARGFLVARSTTDPLFLNVDNAEWDDWEWRPAEQLQFDIPYDYEETKTFQVRRFLQDYRPLLLAAGADNYHAVNFRAQDQAQDGNTLRDAFNDMRIAKQLTNLRLLPREPIDGRNPEALLAHSTFLAATIPHVRVALLDWSESNSDTYPFPGTYFGACAVLDFIYTGKVECDPGETGDAHMTLLRDLLELLRVADEWDMPDLKDEIGRLINEWKLLSRDTYRMIVAEAGKYSAPSLLRYCQDWRDKNPKLVRPGNVVSESLEESASESE